MKPWSKALAILSCGFSMERHTLILDPAAVGIHLLRIIKPASSLFVRNIAAAEQETWREEKKKKNNRRGWLSAPCFPVRAEPSCSSCQLMVQRACWRRVDNTRYFSYTDWDVFLSSIWRHGRASSFSLSIFPESLLKTQSKCFHTYTT